MSRRFRDYSDKRFRNPLFERSTRKPFSWRRLLGAAAVAGLTGLAVWGVTFSHAFDVTVIELQGAQRIAEWEFRDAVNEILDQRILKVIPKRNLILVSESDLVRQLSDRFVLESVVVTKKPPHTIAFRISERVSSILFKTPAQIAVLDLDGSVIRAYRPDERIEDEAQALPILINDRDERLSLRERAVHPNVVEASIALPNAITTRFGGGIGASELHIDGKNGHTLRLVTSEGWAIYLDALQPLEAQLTNAETVLTTKVGADRPKLDYIDVRFGEKIFFKLK